MARVDFQRVTNSRFALSPLVKDETKIMNNAQTEKISPINRASDALREFHARSTPTAADSDNKMNATRKIKTVYWVFTLLFALPLLASGIGFLVVAPPAVEGMAHLGYPVYLIRFLGVAKLLGAVAVLTGLFPRIKEWAYAGLAFNLIGAAYSHLCAGDGPKALGPLMFLLFEALSYFYWRKLAVTSAKAV
jgi:uncharacterized membrane protein YphA (DoxX/SURF4 family)